MIFFRVLRSVCFVWVYQPTAQHDTNLHSAAVNTRLFSIFMQFKMFSTVSPSSWTDWRRTGGFAWFPNLKHLLLNFQAGAFASQREELRGSGNYRKHLQGLRELQTLSVTMKVTVTFGDTAVVVPCKAGWTVRDLIDQATRRYHRILEQVNTEHILLI